jgi:D-alanyl-D-alanine carboxypeptidase
MDGSLTEYGYGWHIGTWQGHRTMEHSGGIHGFATYAQRIPAEGVFVALLSNNPGATPTELLALKIAALLIGQPYQEPTPIVLSAQELAPYVGVYRSAAGIEWTIVCESDRLFVQEAGGPPRAILPVSTTEFYRHDMSLDRLVFTRDTGTSVTALEWRG